MTTGLTRKQLAQRIDHTLLKPDAREKDVARVCEEALAWSFRSVIVHPCYVPLVARLVAESEVVVGGAVGIPLGFQTMAVKVYEAQDAIENGAQEIDMVLNISFLKSRKLEELQEEIERVCEAARGLVTKVVIEACYLTDEEKITACEVICKAGAAFVKTSTGFGPGGATVEDIRLLKRAAGGRVRIKAAGGIRTLETALAMVAAGADRIGTSNGVALVSQLPR